MTHTEIAPVEITAPKSKRAGYTRDPLDWYVEPAWAVDVLCAEVALPGLILDPACGRGTIPRRLTELGHRAVGSDVADRGYGPVLDFLRWTDWRHAPVPDCIVTNPPYTTAVPFIQRARALARHSVAALVRLDFLASQRRRPLINAAARVIVLSKRPSMPPGTHEGPAKGGQHDYCWLVWQNGKAGPPRLTAAVPGSEAK